MPITMANLHRYLGMVMFYHRFLPKAASILAPLSSMLDCDKAARKQLVHWDSSLQWAFEESKALLSQAVLLMHPCSSASVSLCMDALDVAVAGVLQQHLPGDSAWSPISFFSQKLRSLERHYSAYDKELYKTRDLLFGQSNIVGLSNKKCLRKHLKEIFSSSIYDLLKCHVFAFCLFIIRMQAWLCKVTCLSCLSLLPRSVGEKFLNSHLPFYFSHPIIITNLFLPFRFHIKQGFFLCIVIFTGYYV